MRKEVKPTLKYLVIYRKRDKYPIVEMCRFFEVSRSGYYGFVKRMNAPDKDEVIGTLIKDCQQRTRKTYGYRSVKLWLLRETGLIINHKAVLRIMNRYGLLTEIRRRRG